MPPTPSSLHAAARAGNLASVTELLGDKATDINCVDSLGRTAFYMACREGHLDIVKLMNDDSRVDKTMKTTWGYTPVSAADICGHHSVVALLSGITEEEAKARSAVGGL